MGLVSNITVSTQQSEAHHGKRTILVVDDDPSILRVFRRVLERAGYTVNVAGTVTDAQKLVDECCFDAALIDVRLPDMLGIDLLPKIDHTRPTVKIVFTGSPEPEYRLEAERNGADAFLTKPVNPATILGILEEKFRQKPNGSRCPD
jgi:two-component system, NtrC family, response regulator PilR